MPARDNTGPNGMGPMTGRGLGNCRGDNRIQNQGRGMGYGRGKRGGGGGFGLRNRFRFGDEEVINTENDRIADLENALKSAQEEIRRLKAKGE